MELEQKCVANFHKKMGLDGPGGGGAKTEWKPCESNEAKYIAQTMLDFSEAIEEKGFPNGTADVRIHLMIEELAEFILAEDKISAFDGLCDLMYVLLGTFDVYDFPAQEGFAEVHASNMSKQGKDKQRLRDKGEEYRAPDLASVLATYEQRLANGQHNNRDLSLQARKIRADLRRNLDKSS